MDCTTSDQNSVFISSSNAQKPGSIQTPATIQFELILKADKTLICVMKLEPTVCVEDILKIVIL